MCKQRPDDKVVVLAQSCTVKKFQYLTVANVEEIRKYILRCELRNRWLLVLLREFLSQSGMESRMTEDLS
jgi:hypothetical protein